MIDLGGKLVVDFKFTDLGGLEQGIANAKLDGQAGFVCGNGSWAIQPTFDRCYRFFGNLAVVRRGDTYSYIRRNGDIVWTSEPGAFVQAPPAFL